MQALKIHHPDINLLAGSDVISFVDQSPKLALKLGASLTFALSKRLQLQFNYEVRKAYSDHIGMLKLNVHSSFICQGR